MKLKDSKLTKCAKRVEKALAFRYESLQQEEVEEAIELGLAEIITCRLGSGFSQEWLFIKTAINAKTGKSRWTNLYVDDCIIINYFIDVEGNVYVDKAKKISKKSLTANYKLDLDDEPKLFEEKNNDSDIDDFMDSTNVIKDESGTDVIEVDADKYKAKRKKRNASKKA